jgi:hypothetical protein
VAALRHTDRRRVADHEGRADACGRAKELFTPILDISSG